MYALVTLHVHNLPNIQQVRGRVSQGNQGLPRFNPEILVLNR